MARPWLRLYRKIVTNRKIHDLKPSLFKWWILILALTNDDGSLPETDDLAFGLRLSTTKVKAIVEELISAKLLDRHDNLIIAHDWDEHQFDSDTDPTARDRKRRQRARSRTMSRVTEGDGHAKDTRTDTDTDTDKKKIQKASPSAAEPPQSPLDLKKALWASGVAYLKANNVTEGNARSFIGLLRKTHDDVAIVDAFARAEAETAAEPIAFIKAVLAGKEKHASRTQGRRRHHTTPEDVEAFGRALAGFKMDRPAQKP